MQQQGKHGKFHKKAIGSTNDGKSKITDKNQMKKKKDTKYSVLATKHQKDDNQSVKKQSKNKTEASDPKKSSYITKQSHMGASGNKNTHVPLHNNPSTSPNAPKQPSPVKAQKSNATPTSTANKVQKSAVVHQQSHRSNESRKSQKSDTSASKAIPPPSTITTSANKARNSYPYKKVSPKISANSQSPSMNKLQHQESDTSAATSTRVVPPPPPQKKVHVVFCKYLHMSLRPQTKNIPFTEQWI